MSLTVIIVYLTELGADPNMIPLTGGPSSTPTKTVTYIFHSRPWLKCTAFSTVYDLVAFKVVLGVIDHYGVHCCKVCAQEECAIHIRLQTSTMTSVFTRNVMSTLCAAKQEKWTLDTHYSALNSIFSILTVYFPSSYSNRPTNAFEVEMLSCLFTLFVVLQEDPEKNHPTGNPDDASNIRRLEKHLVSASVSMHRTLLLYSAQRL